MVLSGLWVMHVVQVDAEAVHSTAHSLGADSPFEEQQDGKIGSSVITPATAR